MLRPEDYTVGWICAVGPELVAAKLFLDETHPKPTSRADGDTNSYSLGKVVDHNVVIIGLPKGVYGTTSAATATKDMLRSFPNIKIGLVVGIGGGAPTSEHDIRLGDVVVSTPNRDKGGVWQYDFGKTIQGQCFVRTGSHAPPSTLLLTTVGDLEAEYEVNCDQQIEDKIQSVLSSRDETLRKKYAKPDAQSDRLYYSDFIHPVGSDVTCSESCKTNWHVRPTRSTKDMERIHYGTIASANQLMKDACIRDKLATEEGILCFEMEAAGVMNTLPCLIIRGICDYADSHKNKTWQGYAAMAAAAYAKDLLGRIVPTQVKEEKKLVDTIEASLNETNAFAKETHSTVHDWRIQDRRDKIRDWLRPQDPSINFHQALRQRHADTGKWILQHQAFCNWQKTRNCCLWLHGIPGCGKTVLSSSIIQALQGHSKFNPLLYFYFNFNDTGKQETKDMLRTLTYQIASQRADCDKILEKLHLYCEHGGRQPSDEEICEIFSKMIEEAGEVWIVLDALDESTTRTGTATWTGLLDWISSIMVNMDATVHLLITSRTENDINVAFRGLDCIKYDIPLRGDDIDKDIRQYAHDRVCKEPSLKRWEKEPEIRQEIEESVLRNADGMFRLVACRIDAIRDCKAPPELKKALESLPDTLGETYDQILHKIPKADRPAAIRLLQLLIVSPVPLTISEAVDALVVDVNSEPFFCAKDRLPDPEELLAYCLSLVTTGPHSTASPPYPDEHNNSNNSNNIRPKTVIQLAHFSVKEHLLSDKVSFEFRENFQHSAVNSTVMSVAAEICVAYLLGINENIPKKTISSKYPFAEHCSINWAKYAATERKKEDNLHRLIMRFLSTDSQCFLNWLKMRSDMIESMNDPAIGLYWASRFGLQLEVKRLLQEGANVNAQGGDYSNALQVASAFGKTEIVQLLIDNGANVNAQGGHYSNALQAAAIFRNTEIVQLLIDNGANVNTQGGDYSNALQVASAFGNTKIVQLLIDNGANVNAQGGDYSNALQVASAFGKTEIVQLLIDNGANVNAKGGEYSNALQAASYFGETRVVQLLIDYGANVNAKGGRYNNALQAASYRGYTEIVQLLIDNGANVNAKGGDYDNALQAASYRGKTRVVQLLIDNGANVNAQGRIF